MKVTRHPIPLLTGLAALGVLCLWGSACTEGPADDPAGPGQAATPTLEQLVAEGRVVVHGTNVKDEWKDPLLFIDGKRTTWKEAEEWGFTMNMVESISVIKGTRAKTEFGVDPRVGVMNVKLKKPAER